jgi:hypothetical protein
MNPRKTTITILVTLSMPLALAEDFKTINGKEYKNATVSHIEADGIVLRTKSGISKVLFCRVAERGSRTLPLLPSESCNILC